MVLDEQDKDWILQQFERVETRFSQRLEHVETRLEQVETRLEQTETRFSERLEQVETRFSERLEQVETRFSERLEQVETRLLTEFHKWASPNERRQRTHAVDIRSAQADIEELQDRVKALEEKLRSA